MTNKIRKIINYLVHLEEIFYWNSSDMIHLTGNNFKKKKNKTKILVKEPGAKHLLYFVWLDTYYNHGMILIQH